MKLDNKILVKVKIKYLKKKFKVLEKNYFKNSPEEKQQIEFKRIHNEMANNLLTICAYGTNDCFNLGDDMDELRITFRNTTPVKSSNPEREISENK